MTQSFSQALPDASRLLKAERRGLRLAIVCRTVAVGAAFLWVGGSWMAFGFYPNPLIFVVLGLFTAVGIAHASVIGTRFDHFGVALRTGHHCAMSVMQFFDVAATARVSFGCYTTRAEIDTFLHALDHAREMLG